MATKTRKVTREQAEAVLAAVRKQFIAYCATHAETAEMYADDPELVDVLTKYADGRPKPEDPQPVIVENFEWVTGMVAPYAIVWEEGPYEWAYNAIHGGTDEEFGGTIQPADPIHGVTTEAYTTWALGIYPEEA